MTQKLDWKRAVLLGVGAVAGIATGVYGQTLIHGNVQATQIIVTVFTVLAGFLVAIITIMGDPSAFLPGSWRIASKQRLAMRRRLRRQKLLFYVYLVTLALVFATMLVRDIAPAITAVLERVYLGLAVAGFIWSLGLPTALMSIQEERVDVVIEARRRGSGAERSG